MIENRQMIIESEKRIPVIGTVEVAVVGSGIAGSAAAISAARNGSRVIMIEKLNSPGGLATHGLIYKYLPLCDGFGNKLIGGLAEEFLRVSIKYGPGKIPAVWKKSSERKEGTTERYMTLFNPASFMISLEELLIKDKVEILYDSKFCDVVMEDDRISYIIIENKSGRCAISTQTVVDATGDADVCFLSGENTISSNENRFTVWFYAMEKNNLKAYTVGDPLYEVLPEGKRTFSGDDYKDVTDFSILARRSVLKKINEIKKTKKDIYPVLLPSIPQFRMTRRLNGNYVLSGKDEKKFFNDTVGMTGDWRKAGPIFCIPLRSLLAVKTKNLIVAGRCLSASDDGWDVTRAMGVCALTGEVAGTATSLAVKKGISLDKINISELQNRLKKQGIIMDKELLGKTK